MLPMFSTFSGRKDHTLRERLTEGLTNLNRAERDESSLFTRTYIPTTAAIKGHSGTLQNSKNRKLKYVPRVFLTSRILHIYI